MTNLRDTHKTYRDPAHNFEGHIKSVERHCNSMRDLAHLTHMQDFVDETSPLIASIRDNCGKLYAVSKKYREKAKG